MKYHRKIVLAEIIDKLPDKFDILESKPTKKN